MSNGPHEADEEESDDGRGFMRKYPAEAAEQFNATRWRLHHDCKKKKLGEEKRLPKRGPGSKNPKQPKPPPRIPTPDLRLLRTCKQVYREANLIPYKTHTFIFHNPYAFGEFFEMLNTAQKNSITHISLIVEWTNRMRDISNSRQLLPDLGFWNMVLTPSLITQLVGLKKLNVRLDECFNWRLYDDTASQGAMCAERLLLFSKLPQRLNEVTVVITGEDGGRLPDGAEPDRDDDRGMT